MADLFSFDELEDLDITENYNMYNFSEDFTASPLCVPQDPLEDIELFPSFMDNKINLKDLNDLDWCNTAEKEKPRRVALQECNSDNRFLAYGGGFVSTKKQRSKREGKRAWSTKEVNFAAENEEPGGCGARRRCSHCETTETPQWRIGPLGPKTLCNACGVRYKSGRLLPEYRPAASPTFDSQKYSNFHKKILKKRGSM